MPSMIRRQILRGLAGTSSLALLAGCLGEESPGTGDDATTDSVDESSDEPDDESDDERDEESDDGPTERPPPEQQAPAEGDPVEREVETSLEDHRTDDPETICYGEAAGVIESTLEEAFDEDLTAVDASAPYRGSGYSLRVTLRTILDGDGTIVQTPAVEFDEVLEATPEDVTMTVRIDDETYECSDTVTVVQETEREE